MNPRCTAYGCYGCSQDHCQAGRDPKVTCDCACHGDPIPMTPSYSPEPHANAEVHAKIMEKLKNSTLAEIAATAVAAAAAGIYTADGKLTEHYAPKEENTKPKMLIAEDLRAFMNKARQEKIAVNGKKANDILNDFDAAFLVVAKNGQGQIIFDKTYEVYRRYESSLSEIKKFIKDSLQSRRFSVAESTFTLIIKWEIIS